MISKLVICGLSVVMAALCSSKTEWLEEHKISVGLIFAIMMVIWMSFFIWFAWFLGLRDLIE